MKRLGSVTSKQSGRAKTSQVTDDDGSGGGSRAGSRDQDDLPRFQTESEPCCYYDCCCCKWWHARSVMFRAAVWSLVIMVVLLAAGVMAWCFTRPKNIPLVQGMRLLCLLRSLCLLCFLCLCF